MTRIPFYDLAALHSELGDELAAAMRRVLDSNRLVLGPECAALEDEFARYCGAAHAVGTGNGLDALTMALTALGIGPGDEVVVPGQTFVATWLAVTAAGATPVPADVSATTGQLDPAAVRAALTPRSAAVIAVHLFGAMAPVRDIAALCAEAGIALVEDAAQAHGAALDGRRAGAWSDAAAFSFYPGKNLGALGDGGMVVTPHADVADRLRMLRNYGSRRKYEHEQVGGNSRLDELQAAVLRVKLPRLDGWNARRRELAERYTRQLRGRASVCLPALEPGTTAVHHLYPVLIADRAAVQRQLEAVGIETGVHYPTTPGKSGAYAPTFGAAHLPHSDAWARRELSLPMGPTMTDGEVDEVVDQLLRATVDTVEQVA